jgi:mycoredoxin
VNSARAHDAAADGAARPIVFGADWCEDTQRALRLLRRLSVAHDYLNVDEDRDALHRAVTLNAGVRRTPVIELAGAVVVEPSNEALLDALVAAEIVTREDARERLAVQNVGDLERAGRAAAGVLLLAGAQLAPRGLRGLVRLGGAWLAFTGITGWCPGYTASGVTSLEGPGDRPHEATRRSWLAPVERSR